MQALIDFCVGVGWPGLALLAFTAATLVPVGSEWLLAMQLAGAHTIRAQLFLVLVATVANTGGGAVTYGLGRAGIRLAGRDPALGWPRVAVWVRRYGALVGLLGWVPMIGDPSTLLCGIARVPARWFLLFSAVGRLGRYLAIWAGLSSFGRA